MESRSGVQFSFVGDLWEIGKQVDTLVWSSGGGPKHSGILGVSVDGSYLEPWEWLNSQRIEWRNNPRSELWIWKSKSKRNFEQPEVGKNHRNVFSWKLTAKGFQRGRVIGHLVKCYCQMTEYTDLKLAIRYNKGRLLVTLTRIVLVEWWGWKSD